MSRHCLGTVVISLLLASPARAQRTPPGNGSSVIGNDQATLTLGISVRDYGAVPDGTTDSTSAIQAAIDAATTSPNHRKVLFPSGGSGCYMLSAPIIIDDSRLVLEGEGRFQMPCVRNLFPYKLPMFWVGQPFADATYAASLATGTGRALVLPGTSSGSATWIDLGDAGEPAQLNGRSAATIELFVKPTAVPSAGSLPLIMSSGTIGDGSFSRAFQISVTSDRRWLAEINVAGSGCVVTTSAGAYLPNTVYHVALVFDGSTVELFYGTPGETATSGGTTACSGTIAQAIFEHTPLGGGYRNAWPHGSYAGDTAAAIIDSIRFSKTARYTAPFRAPTAKLSADGDTLLLENFDNETARFSIIQSRNGSDGVFATTYLPKRGRSYPTQMGGVSFKGLEINSGNGIASIWMVGLTESTFEDLFIRNGVFGITSPADSFMNEYRGIRFLSENTTVARAALALRASSGLSRIETCRFWGWPIGALIDAGSVVMTNSYFHGDYQVYPLIVRDTSEANILGNSFSNEDTSTTSQLASILFSTVQIGNVIGAGIERTTSGAPGPAIRVYGGKSLSVINSDVYTQRGAVEVIEVLNPPAGRIVVQNGTKDQAAVPWSTSSSVTVWPPSLAGAPTISSGFGVSASVTAGDFGAFRVNVGTGGSASTGVITMPRPPAPTGWNCSVADVTDPDSHNTVQIGSTTTTVSVKNYGRTTGTATAWTASDILALSCAPY